MVAGVTNQSTGMFLGVHLGEPFRFGGTGFMALRAQHGRVRFERNDGEIFRMLRLRAMASLACDSGMFALDLFIEDIGVAAFAGLVPGVHDGQRRNLRNGVAAVMSVFPKAVRDQEGSNNQEPHYPHHKHGRDAEQMFGVLHDRHMGNLRSNPAATPCLASSTKSLGLAHVRLRHLREIAQSHPSNSGARGPFAITQTRRP